MGRIGTRRRRSTSSPPRARAFETCYAAPLCGPSRCLLLTGRYAFRTGGLNNGSWRNNGPGAKAADEWSIAKVLKQRGYVTGESGKWRQVGETPGTWGFDEYCSDLHRQRLVLEGHLSQKRRNS